MFDQDELELMIADDSEEIEIEFIDDDDQEVVSEKPQSGPVADQPDLNDDDSPDAEKLQHEIDHLREMYLRKLAEFDNFRKRIERERLERERPPAKMWFGT